MNIKAKSQNVRSYRWTYLSCIAVLLAVPGTSYAQEASSGPAGADDEIVVTANKREQSTLDVAASVSSISTEQLDRASAVKLADYAAFIPGLQVQEAQGSGLQTVVLRGISPLGTNPTTALYIDEIPVNSVGNYANGAVLPPDIDPAELKRVEVLQGPQGTLYGSSSLGGLVKYVTREPSLTGIEGHASADVFTIAHGDFGTELRGGLSLPLVPGTLALGVSGHYRKNPGYIDDVNLEGRDANSGESKGGRIALLWAPGDWRIQASALVSRVNGDANNIIRINPATREPVNGSYRTKHVTHTRSTNNLDLYSLTIEHDFGFAALTSATGYADAFAMNQADASLSFLPLILGLPANQGVQLVTPINLTRFTQEVRLASSANDKFEWLAGGFYSDEDFTSVDTYDATNPDGSIRALPAPFHPVYTISRASSTREFALFANASFHFTPDFWVTGGYRWSSIKIDDRSSKYGYFGNPSAPAVPIPSAYGAKEKHSTYLASLSWKPGENVLVYARAASGYRPGGTRNRPAGAPADFETFYNSDSLWNYEVGLKAEAAGGRLSATLDGFWIDWSDIQQQYIVNTFSVIGNGGKARSRGIEASLSARPIGGLQLFGNLTYTDATFTQPNPALSIVAGQRIPYASRWSGAVGAEYSLNAGGSAKPFLGGDIRFKSKGLGFDQFPYDGYTLVGLHAGVEVSNIRVMAYATNLLGQQNIVAGISARTQNPFEALYTEPRKIGLAVSTRF